MRSSACLSLAVLIAASAPVAAEESPARDAVSCQGFIQRTPSPLIVRSPAGAYTMEIVPTAGDFQRLQADLVIASTGGRPHRLHGVQGNAFFLSDRGQVIVIDRPEPAASPSLLRLLDLEGKERGARSIDLFSSPILSTDGKNLAYRTKEGITVLDLASLEETSHAPLGPFAVGREGRIAGITPSGDLRIEGGRVDTVTLPVEFRPVRIAFSWDGAHLLVLGANALVRIDPRSGNRDLLFAAPSGAALRDLNVTTEEIQVGMRRIEGETYRGELVRLARDGRILGRRDGPSKRIPAAGDLPITSRGIPWPLQPDGQHSIGNTYGEYQNYGSSYLHPGVDVFGSPNQPVYAVRDGIVKAILTTAGQWHWRIAIGDSATAGTTKGYLYAHIDQSTIAVNVGDAVVQGQYLGELVPWPIYNFTHIHFARIQDTGQQWYGSWLCTENPHLDFTNQAESAAPVFEPARGSDLLAFCDNQTSNYQNPGALHGQVDIIAHVGDTIESSWVCSVQEIRYTIHPLGNPGYPIVDDRLAVYFDMALDTYQGGPIDPFLVSLLYKKDGTCNTQGDYDFREFYHIITNSDGDQDYEQSDLWEAWDTTVLPDGLYMVVVTAMDVVGNATTESMVVATANGNPVSVDPGDREDVVLRPSHPNPGVGGTTITFALPSPDRTMLRIYDTAGRLVRVLTDAVRPEGIHSVEWDGRDAGGSRLPTGIYLYQLRTTTGTRTGKVTLVR